MSPEPVRALTVLLEPEERPTLEAARASLIAEAEAALPAEIQSPEEYRAIAAIEKRVDDFLEYSAPIFDDNCKAAHKAWRSACDIRDHFLAVPKLLKARARTLLGLYKAKEEQQRRAEERRIAEEYQRELQERQRAEATLLDSQGQKELAEALRQSPVLAPVVELPSAVPDVAGLSYREDWYWQPVGGDTPANRVRALSMLVKPEYLPFVQLNDSGLTQFAKRTKGTIRVPGIEFRSRQVAVRR